MKNFSKLISIVLLITIIACERDNLDSKTESEHHINHSHKNGFDFNTVELQNKPIILNHMMGKKILQPKLAKNGSILNITIGTLLLNEVKTITDSIGNTTYTIRFKPSAKIANSFSNFIVEEDFNDNVTGFYVREYILDREFAIDLRDGNKQFTDFKGKIRNHDISTYVSSFQIKKFTCEEDPNLQPPCEIVIDPSDPNDGGDGNTNDPSDPTDSNNNTSGGSGTGGASGGSSTGNPGPSQYLDCETIVVQVICSQNTTGHYGQDPTCIASFKGSSYTTISCSWVELKNGGCNDAPVVISFEDLPSVLDLSINGREAWVNANCGKLNILYKLMNPYGNIQNEIQFAEMAIDILSDTNLNEVNKQIQIKLLADSIFTLTDGLPLIDYINEMNRMSNHLLLFGNPEDKLFAQYILSLSNDFLNMSVGEVQDIYKLVKEQIHNLRWKYLFAVVTPVVTDLIYPVLHYAILEMSIGAATPIFNKFAVSFLLRGPRLYKLVQKLGQIGTAGTSNNIRLVNTINPSQKATEIFNRMTKDAFSKVTQSNGAIVADMGNGNYITYRPISASTSNFEATISLDFRAAGIWTQIRQIKFLP